MTELRPFQRRFIRGALAPGIDTAALSIPRGNGKSFLAGKLLTRFLIPGAPMETRCKASAFPQWLGSLRLPHFPQPRRRNHLQTINQGVGPFYSIGVGPFYVVKATVSGLTAPDRTPEHLIYVGNRNPERR